MLFGKRSKKKTENGSATVEACVAFTGFLFVLFTLLNVVNYCRAQMLVASAMDNAAKELSQYAYFYKMSGLQKFDSAVRENAKTGADNLNGIVGTVDTLYSTLQTAGKDASDGAAQVQAEIQRGEPDLKSVINILNGLERDGINIETAFNSMTDAFKDVGDNPILYMKSLIAVAGNESLDLLKSYVIAAPLAKYFFYKQFGSNKEEADAALKKLGIKDGLEGMNFNMSTVFATGSEEDIHLAVYYRIKLTQFFKFAELELPVCKEAVTRAWLAGDMPSEGFKPAVN